MWEYVDPMTSDEIYHYGTKGMHWGERLYQNPDGSLTQLGRLRYGNKSNYNRVQAAKALIKKKKIQARTDAEVAKYRKKAQETYDEEFKKRSESEKKEEPKKETSKNENNSDSKNKTDSKKETTEKVTTEKANISQMSDRELQDKVNRMRLEQDYQRIYKEMNPQTVSRGKKFVNKLLDDSLNAVAKGVGEAMGSSAKNYVNKILGEAIQKSLQEEKKSDNKEKKEEPKKKTSKKETSKKETSKNETSKNENNSDSEKKTDPEKEERRLIVYR